MSNQATKKLEGEIGSASQAPDQQRVTMAKSRASDLPVLIVSGADSPRSRIGRSLESIGGMTAETLQRLSSTVGGVVKSPVVLLSKVGGLASPRAAATPTAPPGSSLEERVYHLENQMKRLEEKLNSVTFVTELDLTPYSHKEKPQIAKSLQQKMETDAMLVKRFQILEDRVNERMETFEKALSSIQSRLDHVKFSQHEGGAGHEHQESFLGEPQYYDAEQQSDNFEGVDSPTLENAHVQESSFATPTTSKHAEPLQKIGVGKNDDFLEPEVVSTPVYSKEAFLMQPMKSVELNSESTEYVHRDDSSNLSASSEQQLASTLEGLHKSFVMESSANAASAKFLEIARTVTAEKSTLAHASLKPQPTSIYKELQEAFLEEPLATIPIDKCEEHVQEDIVDKNGTIIATTVLPLPSSEATEEDFSKEPPATIPNAKLIQELETQGVVIIALAPSEPLVTSKSMEKPLISIPSVNYKELIEKDTRDRSVTMTSIGEVPKALAFHDPQEVSMKESLVGAPRIGSTHESSSQNDSNTTSDIALASFESPMASKFVEEPSSTILSANLEELVLEGEVDKSVTMTTVVDSPLVSSSQGFQEDFEKEPQEEKESTITIMDVEPTHESATQEESNMTLTSSKPKVASKYVEELSTVVPNVGFEEHIYKDVVDKSVTMISTREDLQEDSTKESLTIPPNVGSIHELLPQEDLDAISDKAFVSSTPHLAYNFVEKPSSSILSVNSEEPIQDKDVVKSDTMDVGVDSPLASSFEEPQEDYEKESLATTSSCELVQVLATEEDSCMVPTSSKSQEVSKFMEEPSIAIPSANFEELTHEDVDNKSVSMTVAGVLLSTTSVEEPHDDPKKESILDAPSNELAQELASQEDSDVAFSEPQLASKFVEEPSTTEVPHAKFEELEHKDTIDRSGSAIASVESPLVSSLEAHIEDYTKDSLVAGANAKALEHTKEDESKKNPIASTTLEVPSTSFSRISQESPSKEPSEISVHLKELAQEKNGIVLPNEDSTLMSTIEEGNHAMEESEYKLAEDFKIHHEHIENIEKELPRTQSNLAHVDSKESLDVEDSDNGLESDQSSEEFFDVDQGSGNFESWKSDDPKSFEEFNLDPDEFGEAIGINVVAQKEILVPTSSMECIKELEPTLVQECAQKLEQVPTREVDQEPNQVPTPEVDQEPDQVPTREVDQAAPQEVDQEPDQAAPQEVDQEPNQAPAQELDQEPDEAPTPKLDQEPNQAPAQELDQEHDEAPTRELDQELDEAPTRELDQEPDEASTRELDQEPNEAPTRELDQEPDEASTRELDQEPDEAPTREVKQEPNQAPTRELDQEPDEASTREVDQEPDEAPTQEVEEEPNQAPVQELEQKSLDTQDISSSKEALERESLTSAPTTKIAHGFDVGKSDNMHISLEPQLEESNEALVNEQLKVVPSSESTELVQEVGDGQSSAIFATSELQLTPTLEEPQEGFVKEPLADADLAFKSTDFEESLADKPLAITTSTKPPQESVVDKVSTGRSKESPLISIVEEPHNGSASSLVEGNHGRDEVDQNFLKDVKIIAEPIEEAIPRTQSDLTHAKLNPEIVEDTTKLQSQGSFLTFGATSMDSKEALVKESIPPAKLLELFEEENNSGKKNPMLVDSSMTSPVEEPEKELVTEPLASAKSIPKGRARWRGFTRSSSQPQFTYNLEEHRKALAKESSVSDFPSASKLGEEHVQEEFGDTQCLPFKILGESRHPQKESEFKLVEDVKSPVMISKTISNPYVLEPKSSKIKEKKKEKKEKKEKKPNATVEEKEKKEKKPNALVEEKEKKEKKPNATMEEKEKKEKKEKKPNATMEEKEKRLSLELGEIERKNSLRAEEKHKQPFRHLRNRLRHAFSVNKEP